MPTTLTSFAASNVTFYASTNESHFQHMQRIQYKFNTEYHASQLEFFCGLLDFMRDKTAAMNDVDRADILDMSLTQPKSSMWREVKMYWLPALKDKATISLFSQLNLPLRIHIVIGAPFDAKLLEVSGYVS